MRRPQHFAKSTPIIWLAVHRTNNWWIFRKILWPSQNIWILTGKLRKKLFWTKKKFVYLNTITNFRLKITSENIVPTSWKVLIRTWSMFFHFSKMMVDSFKSWRGSKKHCGLNFRYGFKKVTSIVVYIHVLTGKT